MNNSEELNKYAALEGGELGEYCLSLLNLNMFNNDHGASSEFVTAMNKEIDRQLKVFQDSCELVILERTETIKQESLQWYQL